MLHIEWLLHWIAKGCNNQKLLENKRLKDESEFLMDIGNSTFLKDYF